MSESRTYVVTDHAGPKVAGRRVRAGEEIMLTEVEAAGELRAGNIIAGGKNVGGSSPARKTPGKARSKRSSKSPRTSNEKPATAKRGGKGKRN